MALLQYIIDKQNNESKHKFTMQTTYIANKQILYKMNENYICFQIQINQNYVNNT